MKYEYGVEVYEAVMTALDEIDQYCKPLMVGSWSRMGELDIKPFCIAVERKYKGVEADYKARELCYLWKGYPRDANWHPFKVIPEGGGYKEMIDEEDERLKGLKDEYGDEVYEAVMTALNEINLYNPLVAGSSSRNCEILGTKEGKTE